MAVSIERVDGVITVGVTVVDADVWRRRRRSSYGVGGAVISAPSARRRRGWHPSLPDRLFIDPSWLNSTELECRRWKIASARKILTVSLSLSSVMIFLCTDEVINLSFLLSLSFSVRRRRQFLMTISDTFLLSI